jgi:hypothetical protein
MKDNLEEKAKNEEWGAWKFVSDMLDTPAPNGIYQTSKCYELIHDFVVEQKAKARKEATEAHKVEMEELTDAAEMLWVVLANVNAGDWSTQTEEWQEAAIKWRDNYFAKLPKKFNIEVK